MTASEGRLQPASLLRVDLQPGDVVVAVVDAHLSASMRDAMRQELQHEFPAHKCVVIAAPGLKGVALWNEAPAPALQVLLEAIRDVRTMVRELHRLVHEEEQPAETRSLDGDVVSRERDPLQSLG